MDGPVKNIMSPASPDWCRHKSSWHVGENVTFYPTKVNSNITLKTLHTLLAPSLKYNISNNKCNRPTVSFSQARREPARAPGQTTFRAPSHPLPFPLPPHPLPLLFLLRKHYRKYRVSLINRPLFQDISTNERLMQKFYKNCNYFTF